MSVWPEGPCEIDFFEKNSEIGNPKSPTMDEILSKINGFGAGGADLGIDRLYLDRKR